MNWGKGITLSFMLFALFVGALVFLSVREDVSLVTENYYPEDRAYNQQMARMQNASELSAQPHVEVVAGISQMLVSFPEEYADLVEDGKVVLFRPSDEALDQTFMFDTGRPKPFALSALRPGRYKVMLTWSMGGKEYFTEEALSI